MKQILKHHCLSLLTALALVLIGSTTQQIQAQPCGGSPLVLSVTHTYTNCYTSAAICVTVSGGWSDVYNYQWALSGSTSINVATSSGDTFCIENLSMGATYNIGVSLPGGLCHTTRVVVIPTASTHPYLSVNMLFSCDNPNSVRVKVESPLPGAPPKVSVYDQYLWSNGATTPQISGLTAGTYCVTLTSIEGCASTKVLCETAGLPLPTPTVQAATCGMCNGAMIFPNFDDSVFDYDHYYSLNYYLVGQDTIQIQPGMAVQELCSGNYVLIGIKSYDIYDIGTFWDPLYCDTLFAVDEVVLEGLANADFSTSVGAGTALNACTHQAIQFTANGTENIGLSWNFGEANTPDNESDFPNPTHTYTNAGTYTVTLIAQNCYSIDTMQSTITIEDGIVPDITCISVQCPGDTVTYTTSTSCGTYEWTLDGATIIGPNNANTVSVVWDDVAQGNIWLTISNCSEAVCNPTAMATVPLLSSTTVIEGPTVVCGGEVALYSLPTYGGVQYVWSIDPPSAGTIVSGIGTAQIAVQWNNDIDGTVRATWSSGLLACAPNAALPVQVNSPYSIEGDENVCANGNYSYTALAGLHNWSVSGSATIVSGGSNSSTVSVQAGESGSFTVSATPIETDIYCDYPQSITANIISQLAASTLLGESLICPNNSYQYAVDAPDPAYTYEWTVTGGSPTASVGNSLWITWDNSGIYNISVMARLTVSPYCVSPAATLQVATANSVGIGGNTSVCAGDKIDYTALPLLSSLSYAWTVNPPNAGSVVAGQGTAAVSVQWNSGIASAVLSVSACGLSGAQDILIHTATEPLIVTSGNLCEGGSIVLSTDPSTYTDYVWSNGSNGATATIGSEGSYRTTVTDANGCTANAQTSVATYPLPVASISAAQYPAMCIEAPYDVTLYALEHPDYSYQWYRNDILLPGETAPSFTHIATAILGQTIYSVVVTNLQGCSVMSNEVIVSQIDCVLPGGGSGGGPSGGGPGCMLNAGDIINFEPLTPYCNEVTFLNLSNALSYVWNFGDGSPVVGAADNSPITHNYTEPGFYSVILAATFGNALPVPAQCTYLTARVVEIPLIADFRFETACLGSSTAFFDLSNHTPTSSITDWEWDFGDGNSSTDPNPSHIYAAAGTYSVSLSISDGDCIVTSTQDVTIDPLPDATFLLPATLCQYGALAFTPNDQTDIDAYHWTFGDGANVATALPEHAYITSGNFTVSLNLSDFAGCSNSSSQSIDILPVGGGTISSSAAAACAGTPVTLTAPVGTDYAWSTGASSASIEVSNSGVFAVTVTESNGCNFIPDPIALNFSPAPTAAIYPNTSLTVCPNESRQLSADIGSNYSYAWSNGSTTANIVLSYDDFVAPLSLTVTVTNPLAGCSAVSNTISVNKNTVDAPSITPLNPIQLCEGSSTTLTASHTTLNDFVWNTGEIGSSITTSEQGVYMVSVTDANGCANSALVTVLVNGGLDMSVVPSGCYEVCQGDTLTVPNVFVDYQWLHEGSPVNSQEHWIVINQSGDYQFVAHSISGCADTSDVLSVNIVNCSDEETILAITLLHFGGVVQSEGNYLEWLTTAEVNNDHFVLWRADQADAEFQPIAHIAAQGMGNSQMAQHYDYLDRQAPKGTCYYRLQWIDHNGKAQQSHVIALSRNDNGSGSTQTYTLSPNPTHDLIYIAPNSTQQAPQAMPYALYNTIGQAVLRGTYTQSIQSLSLAHLPVGIYYLYLGGVVTKVVKR